jgi:hypothetical protein
MWRARPGSVIEGIALEHGENSLFTLSYRVSRLIAEENGENAFALKTVLADVRDPFADVSTGSTQRLRAGVHAWRAFSRVIAPRSSSMPPSFLRS